MPSVRVRENEYFDAALRRFKRACEKAPLRVPEVSFNLLKIWVKLQPYLQAPIYLHLISSEH